MIIELPDDVIVSASYSEHDFKIDVAVMLYQRKALTLARAANWVGMTRLQFQKILADHKVPMHYSIEDFKSDLTSIQSMPS